MRLAVRGATVETAVDELMNGLAAYGQPMTIVLDDLHALGSERSLQSIAHAIKRLPANARVLISTRSDPAISVARLRVRGALTEIRARDLAFTVEEARDLLLREGIELSDESIELLVERTEGWPAGLYLAALWLRDLDDRDHEVRSLVGSARQVADYLTDEVLTALAPDTRDFLAHPSVVAVHRPICATLSLGERVRRRCSQSSRGRTCSWSPWTHAGVVSLSPPVRRASATGARPRTRRTSSAPARGGLVPNARTRRGRGRVRRRGWRWRNGGRAVDRASPGVRLGRADEQFLGWVRGLPAERLREHPLLPAVGGTCAALLGRPSIEIRQLLAVAEQAGRKRPQLWSPYVEAVVEVTRAMKIERGDVGGAVEHARRALAAARAGADMLSVGVLASLSQALFFAGQLCEARRIALEAVERPDAPDVPDGYVGALGLLALLDAEQGKRRVRRSWARQAISFAHQRFQADSWVASLAHLGLALAFMSTGRLDEAEREALRGERLRRSTAAERRSRSRAAGARAGPRRTIAAGAPPATQARAKGDRRVSRSGAPTDDRGRR